MWPCILADNCFFNIYSLFNCYNHIHLFTHSLTHSLTYAHTIRSLTLRSLTYTHSLIHSLTHIHTHALTRIRSHHTLIHRHSHTTWRHHFQVKTRWNGSRRNFACFLFHENNHKCNLILADLTRARQKKMASSVERRFIPQGYLEAI